MPSQVIPGIEGVETVVESTKRPLGALRTAEGVMPYPAGALTTGLNWKPLWGLDDFIERVENILFDADTEKAHFVKVSKGTHVILVVYSLANSEALGLWYVEGSPSERNLDDTDAVVFESLDNAIWRDKDPDELWFASNIADRIYFGNGVDANLSWKDGDLEILAPNASASRYNRAKESFPPCTSFCMDDEQAIYAAGNQAQPLRVWISEPPQEDFPLNEGIYSSEFSYIDVDYGDATKITALSTWNNYLTVDTDDVSFNLFSLNRTEDGWKSEQAPSGANRGAYNPNCRKDNKGFTSFYFGNDGEIYHDHAARGGNHGKFFKKRVVTDMCTGNWNRGMLREPVGNGYHTIYDRDNGLYILFARLRTNGSVGMWCYNEKTGNIAGPIRYPDAVLSTIMQRVVQGDDVVVSDEFDIFDLGDGTALDLGDGTILEIA